MTPLKRILLVEDNPENVVLVQAYLDNLPLSLDLAVNGPNVGRVAELLQEGLSIQ